MALVCLASLALRRSRQGRDGRGAFRASAREVLRAWHWGGSVSPGPRQPADGNEDRDLMFNSNSVGQRVDPKTRSGLVVVRKPDGVGSCRVCARRTLDVYYAFYLSSFANRIRKAPRGRILCGKSDFIETEGPTTNFIALRSHQHERQSALSARSPT